MRLIDADELIEHAYRDRLDSRELIADMINNAPTIKEIPVNVPLSLIIKALEQEPILDRLKSEIKVYSDPQGFICISEKRLDDILKKCMAGSEDT